MSHFLKELNARALDPTGRRWIYVPYDQLSDEVGPLSREDPSELGIVMVENRWKPRRRPYHKQKLALVLASGRAFALEQAARGVCVRFVVGDGPYASLLDPLAKELGPLRVMEPAERELRVDLAPLVLRGRLEVVPHEGWLTTREQFETAMKGKKHWRMDAFYRRVREDTGILMENGKPVGGKFSFDVENRKPWKGEPPAPPPPRFAVDPIKQEVLDLVESQFTQHPGTLDPQALPVSRSDAQKMWRYAKRRCLEYFGPYEDAMSTHSRTLFHTQISALLNNGRLSPRRVVDDVARSDLPLASQEGFIRQVLGWREFMHHVHERTDGFRSMPGGKETECRSRPGDGGYGRWKGSPWRSGRAPARFDGGAAPSALDASDPVPPAFWGQPSGLACLDQVVSEVWETGYGHHITRLMVLANLATLLGVSPRDLADWFWVAYVDAYDWVVEPNVLGMGTFGLGDRFVTKPYVSGAAYIDRMSDYCSGCAFSPKRDCPITSLYWDFLRRNAVQLEGNPRMAMPLRSLTKRAKSRVVHDAQVTDWVRGRLQRGERLDVRSTSGEKK